MQAIGNSFNPKNASMALVANEIPCKCAFGPGALLTDSEVPGQVQSGHALGCGQEFSA